MDPLNNLTPGLDCNYPILPLEEDWTALSPRAKEEVDDMIAMISGHTHRMLRDECFVIDNEKIALFITNISQILEKVDPSWWPIEGEETWKRFMNLAYSSGYIGLVQMFLKFGVDNLGLDPHQILEEDPNKPYAAILLREGMINPLRSDREEDVKRDLCVINNVLRDNPKFPKGY